MALQDWEKFRGITNINRDILSQNLLYGTIDYLRWAFLNIGGFQNISRTTGNIFGGPNRSVLRQVNDPNFSGGGVWEGYRYDWVWETGINFVQQPTQVTGVWVDGTFSSPTGAYPHYIDYPRGRVVFTGAAPTGVVEAEFAHRTVNVVKANEPWFQEIMYNSYDMQIADYQAAASGNWDQLAQTRLQLPAVGVELVSKRGYKPYQLGWGQWVYQDVLFYVFADNDDEARQLGDILSEQNNQTIWIPNRGLMKEDPRYPIDLDGYGRPVASPMQYPAIVAPTGQGGFQWRKVAFTNGRMDTMEPVNNWLHRNVVRSTMEIIMENI